jgi:hypothetical protein
MHDFKRGKARSGRAEKLKAEAGKRDRSLKSA